MEIGEVWPVETYWRSKVSLRLGGHLALTDLHPDDPSELTHIALPRT